MNQFDSIKESILSSVPAASERALLDQIEISEEKGTVVVHCPNVFSHRYLTRQYKDLIIRSIREKISRAVEVEFSVNHYKKPVPEHAESDVPVQMVLPSLTSPQKATGLNAKYTFEEFIVGRCNAFAYEAACAVSEIDTPRYNPLYFYSDVGLGKSHIAHAIGNKVIKSRSNTSVLYMTARDFSHDYVYSAHNNMLNTFKNNFRRSNIDVFFIDDVHLFQNKHKTQLELCHVLDDLLCAGKQVIFSGYRPPTSFQQIDKGLKSRFSSGLMIDIKRPDKSTRAKIVRHKANKNAVVLPEDVVEFISTNVHSNIRDLESAVMTIIAMGSLMKREITLDLAKEFLEGTLEKQERITIPYILEFISKNFELSPEILISPSRKRDIIYPRQIAIFLCRRYTDEPLQTIGTAFSRKHSSIIHSLETIENKYTNNLKVKREIDFLIEKLESEAS
ncbi:MAG: chromosomal replication initiator protein DnaA [Desulfomonilia bacterium]